MKYVLIPDCSHLYFVEPRPELHYECKLLGAYQEKVIVHEIKDVACREVEQFNPYEGNLYKRQVIKVFSIDYKDWCARGINHSKTEFETGAVYIRDIEYVIWIADVDLNTFPYKFKLVGTDYKLNDHYLMGLVIYE